MKAARPSTGLLGELRPKLHRYCARMTGSVIDGEDVVQEALMKAINAFPQAGPVADLDGWLFRIAHNAALDFLRRRRRYEAIHSNEELEMIAAISEPDIRSSGCGSEPGDLHAVAGDTAELCHPDGCARLLAGRNRRVTGTSVPAVKAALNRGRKRLREMAKEPEDLSAPALAEPEQLLLA